MLRREVVVKLMRIQCTLSGFNIDVQQPYAKFELVRCEFAGDDTAVLAPANHLDIKQNQVPVGGKSDQIDGALFNEGGIDIATLCQQPLSGHKLTALAISDPPIRSHLVIDSPINTN